VRACVRASLTAALDSCRGVSDIGANLLVSGLGGNLESLNLSYCGVSDACIPWLTGLQVGGQGGGGREMARIGKAGSDSVLTACSRRV
jgi:hypothetical protein